MRTRRAAGCSTAVALVLLWAAHAAAIIRELSPADIRRALEEGARAVAEEDFGTEWRVRLPGGEEVAVTTPYARLAHAARHAAFKDEPLTDKQLQEQIDRGKGKLQLVVTVYGRQVDFARWYQPVLRAGGRDVKAAFTQNERTALRLENGRFAARNVYVFPLEGLPAQGTVTLVVEHSIEKKEILRVPLDLSRMR